MLYINNKSQKSIFITRSKVCDGAWDLFRFEVFLLNLVHFDIIMVYKQPFIPN